MIGYHSLNCVWTTLLVVASATLTACENTLVFTERTKAAISVEFNPTNASEPVQLTAGYKRSIVGVVPPKQPVTEDNRTHKGEALSLISNFALGYENNEQSNTLYVRNGFASGKAASIIATNPVAVRNFLEPQLLTPLSEVQKKWRSQAAAVLMSANQAQLDSLAREIGVATGTSARKNIRSAILDARSNTEFKVICEKIKESQVEGSEGLICQ